MALRDRILFFFLGSILLQAWCRCLFWAIPCFLFGLVQSRRGKNERRKKFNIILPGGWLSIPFCFHTQLSSQWILWQWPIRPSSALLAFFFPYMELSCFPSLKQMTTLFILIGFFGSTYQWHQSTQRRSFELLFELLCTRLFAWGYEAVLNTQPLLHVERTSQALDLGSVPYACFALHCCVLKCVLVSIQRTDHSTYE